MFSEAEVTSVRQRPVREEMAEVPSEEEVLEAVMKMKNGKAAGESGILSEMVKPSLLLCVRCGAWIAIFILHYSHSHRGQPSPAPLDVFACSSGCL